MVRYMIIADTAKAVSHFTKLNNEKMLLFRMGLAMEKYIITGPSVDGT